MSLFSGGVAKDIARPSARKLAKNFGGRDDSDRVFKRDFNHMWELMWRAKQYSEENHNAMVGKVRDNLDSMSSVVGDIEADSAPTGPNTRRTAASGPTHLRHYRSAPTAGKFVVFSDIHITEIGNRQDFFARKNKDLYLDLLATYYSPEGFSLIENGDVEELLIFEPDIDQMPNYETASWSTILSDRTERKRAQFDQIVSDHSDYYELVHNHFIAADRYYRTIGNHDTDLSSQTYANVISDALNIAWPTASDIVALTDRDGDVDVVICHGHQFDAFCTDGHAVYAGESFSQGTAWAYQGPDRYWSVDEDGPEFLDKWLSGEKLFHNILVSDDPGLPSTDWRIAEALAGQAAGTLQDPDKWEALYGKNVAWEYFENSSPMAAYSEEVQEGVRWYKYRHMDEIEIVGRWESQFGGMGTRLLLGHSHEPRLRSSWPGMPQMEPRITSSYLNSAAAGRFENLIWGIEFLDGEATIISWNREGGEIVRTIWEDETAVGMSFLRAGQKLRFAPTRALPADDSPTSGPNFPIEAITHMMFSA